MLPLPAFDDSTLEIVLGPCHPEDAAPEQVQEVSEVHVGLVKQDDFTGPQSGAHLARPFVVVMFGGVDDRTGGQEALQVQPPMAFGGGFAATMLGPVQAGGHQLDGGGIHGVNGALEAVEQALALSAAGKVLVEAL
jgi:hypothetical protein